MDLFIRGQPGVFALPLLLTLLINFTACQELNGDSCLSKFKTGKDDFILDVDESVKDGATFISVPKATRYQICVASCCKEPRCNVAVMEKGDEEDSIRSCFLFDCVYKQKYACHFVSKPGFFSYVSDLVYDSYIALDSTSDLPDKPPVADAGPDKVVQPHEDVTLSGYKSRDDKEGMTYSWKMLTDYPYAIIQKTNFKDEISVSNLTSGKYKFELTVTDSDGQTDTTMITVLVLTPEQSDHHCMAPKKIGPCRGSFPRWHYNAASGKCEEFIFGGCKENANNYLREDECIKACTGAGKAGRLLQPVDPEEKCGALCTQEQFTCDNGCCLDPGLECDGEPQCKDDSDEKECDLLTKKFEILITMPLDEKKARCTEHPDTGPCRESHTKWYYNPINQECLSFNYGGCEGNNNKFDSEGVCKTTCSGVTSKDVFAQKKAEKFKSSDDQTVPLAIAIVLGVGILILLGILGYCFMKKKKSSQHAHVPVSNSMMEDRDHLVYNTTTKAI